MTNYAVLTYKYFSDKPAGIPDDYPAVIRGLGASTILPPGNGWQLMSQAQLDACVSSHQAGYSVATERLDYDDITDRVLKAMDFGRLMIARIAADNVSRGLTADQIMDVMVKGSTVIAALNCGSLYIAINALNAIVPDSVVTADRIKTVRNQIEAYLGIPQT